MQGGLFMPGQASSLEEWDAVRSRTPSPESYECMGTHERCVCFTTRVLSHSNNGALTPPGSPTLGRPRLLVGSTAPAAVPIALSWHRPRCDRRYADMNKRKIDRIFTR